MTCPHATEKKVPLASVGFMFETMIEISPDFDALNWNVSEAPPG